MSSMSEVSKVKAISKGKVSTSTKHVSAPAVRLLDTERWEDGTPKSTHYPWVWKVEPKAPKPLTREQAQEEKNRVDTLARWRAKRAKAAAERVNTEASTASFIPKSVRAPR